MATRDRDIPSKTCRRCKQTMPPSAFSADSDYKSGRKATCKSCIAEKKRVRYRSLCAEATGRVVDWSGRKKCSKCGKEKERTDFYRMKSSADGIGGMCKSCTYMGQSKNRSMAKAIQALLANIEYRSRGRLDVNIDAEYLQSLWDQQQGLCKYTGLQMELNRNPRKSMAWFRGVSVDRIDPKRGYVRGNVQLLCNWANTAKNALHEDAFFDFIKLAHDKANEA